MATKIPGETYRGEAVTLPLSEDGQVSVYVWPCRILNVGGMGMGGMGGGRDAVADARFLQENQTLENRHCSTH